MFDKRFLNLTPTQFFCPFCGKWHDWGSPAFGGTELDSYSIAWPYEYECCGSTINICPSDNGIYIYVDYFCNRLPRTTEFYVDFDTGNNIDWEPDEPVIKVSGCIRTNDIICSSECRFCQRCNLPNIGDEREVDESNQQSLKLVFMFKFSKEYFALVDLLTREEKLKKLHENELKKQQEPETSESPDEE